MDKTTKLVLWASLAFFAGRARHRGPGVAQERGKVAGAARQERRRRRLEDAAARVDDDAVRHSSNVVLALPAREVVRL